MLNFKYLK
ncbi:hypothetical protein QE152_g25036, partial [Popillia japonica]